MLQRIACRRAIYQDEIAVYRETKERIEYIQRNLSKMKLDKTLKKSRVWQTLNFPMVYGNIKTMLLKL